MSSVACLMSLYWPDRASREMWRDAVKSLQQQPGLERHLFVRVVCGDAEPVCRWLRGRGWLYSHVTATKVREPQPVTWNGLYRDVSQLWQEGGRPAFVAILNADDEWRPSGLTRLVSELERHPEANTAYGDYAMWDGSHVAGRHWPGSVGNVLQPGASPIWQDPVCGPFWVARVADCEQLVQDRRLFDETLHRCADHHLWVRLARRGGERRWVRYVDEPVGLMLRRGNSLFASDPEGAYRERLRIREWGRAYLGAGACA